MRRAADFNGDLHLIAICGILFHLFTYFIASILSFVLTGSILPDIMPSIDVTFSFSEAPEKNAAVIGFR